MSVPSEELPSCHISQKREGKKKKKKKDRLAYFILVVSRSQLLFLCDDTIPSKERSVFRFTRVGVTDEKKKKKKKKSLFHKSHHSDKHTPFRCPKIKIVIKIM